MTEFTDTVKEQYAAEVAQSDYDHKHPTAGAMTNHIISNHVVMTNRLRQARWFVKGLNAGQLAATFKATGAANFDWIDRIGQDLLDEDEIPANIASEYAAWNMLAENGEAKYLDAAGMIDGIIHDFNTDNLFVTRAIALAQKENKPVLAAELTALYGWNNRQIRQYQALLGNTARVGLNEEDEDNDD
ncbi:ferritin-like domain-containing protein [Lacticaseibacillus pabuli]|uniref:Ferritin-like domain-containing protein n=1 Tax=Lacticaseibacillus pabuli TaxID=3025672 RepID=A0ABY7WTW9_9LACO|nr:ferritin-like domain-containing protein [Lacticaseibacillus sp. KACC 23028]WDF82913.1 ferritin-like domain-containing protein [Lacticaseibacillus sp. KACC 23028]